MFRAARVFSQRNPETGLIEWFFSAREGSCGPFRDMQSAAKALEAFIQNRKKYKDDGGRKIGDKKGQLSLEPMIDFVSKRKD